MGSEPTLFKTTARAGGSPFTSNSKRLSFLTMILAKMRSTKSRLPQLKSRPDQPGKRILLIKVILHLLHDDGVDLVTSDPEIHGLVIIIAVCTALSRLPSEPRAVLVEENVRQQVNVVVLPSS